MVKQFPTRLVGCSDPNYWRFSGADSGNHWEASSGPGRTWWWPLGQLPATHALHNHYYHSDYNPWKYLGWIYWKCLRHSVIAVEVSQRNQGGGPDWTREQHWAHNYPFLVVMMGKFSNTDMNTKSPICLSFVNLRSLKTGEWFCSVLFSSQRSLGTYTLRKRNLDTWCRDL